MADEQEEVYSPDVHFEPIVKLPIVEIKTMEENEEVLFQMRAKLFRYEAENSEWKERGTGEIKLLRHVDDCTVRILMRRDKTLKICANHLLHPYMELKPNSTSDRAWIWKTFADFADEEPKSELLAIRFGSAENAQKFKAAFDDAKKLLKTVIVVDDEGTDDGEEEEEEEDEEEKENKETSLKEDKKEAEAETKQESSEKDDASEKKQTENITTKLEELSVKDSDAKPEECSNTT